MDENMLADSVMVQVVPITGGRAISWGDSVTEKLKERVDDIRAAIIAGAKAVALYADAIPSTKDWEVSELSVSFGITLAAQAGVVLSQASAEATFEVNVTFRRT